MHSYNTLYMKTCNRCKKEKELIDFSKHKLAKDQLRSYCKQCANEYAKKYYEKNIDKVKNYYKSYRKNNQERLKKAHKEWHKENSEKAKNYAKEYREYNKEKCNNMTKNWRKNNKLKFSNLVHKRNEKLQQNGIFQIIKKDLVKLQRSNCFYCGSIENLSLDHIYPISKGGRHSIGNLVMACKSCNSSKNNKFLFSWLVSK